jgi:hypothetical protein
LSFLKGLKKKKQVGENTSEAQVTNQLSTFNTENERLDPGAYTETNPNAGQTKTAAKGKPLDFVGGFKKVVKNVAPNNDPLRLYPGPEQPWNISGSDKVANAAFPAPPKPPGRGGNPALKGMQTPTRVTPTMGPFGAPKGGSSVTGVPTTRPFGRAISSFGNRPRKALKAMSSVRGM